MGMGVCVVVVQCAVDRLCMRLVSSNARVGVSSRGVIHYTSIGNRGGQWVEGTRG